MGALLTNVAAHVSGNEVLNQLVGTAPAFREVVSKLPMLARTDAVVLITGETGTGTQNVSAYAAVRA